MSQLIQDLPKMFPESPITVSFHYSTLILSATTVVVTPFSIHSLCSLYIIRNTILQEIITMDLPFQCGTSIKSRKRLVGTMILRFSALLILAYIFFYLSCEKPRQISGKHLQSQFVKALLGFVCLLSVQSSHYYSKALPISLPFWTSNVQ